MRDSILEYQGNINKQGSRVKTFRKKMRAGLTSVTGGPPGIGLMYNPPPNIYIES